VAPVRADFVFQAGDTAALTRTLRTALADPKALREAGRRGFDYVERNSPEKIVAATLEAVRKGVEVANRGK
jgi:hypothetical protein